jgi:hypothetical protein
MRVKQNVTGKKKEIFSFEVLTPVTVSFFRDVTPCNPVEFYRRFGQHSASIFRVEELRPRRHNSSNELNLSQSLAVAQMLQRRLLSGSTQVELQLRLYHLMFSWVFSDFVTSK